MANTARRIGILLLGELPPGRLAEFSRHVEAAGFSELWLAEDYFFLSGFASAAIALQATTRIKVGIGAVANRVRHPAVTAMEATTLAGAFPGRFDSLGVGHGLPFWMRQMKLYPKSVLTSLREAVIGIRRLARGETLTENGEYYSYDQVKLVHPAPDLKILTAVVQAKSMELTAQIADGLILSVLAGPDYVRSVIKQLAAHWPAAGPPPGFQIVTYALACVERDRAAARRSVRVSTAFYLHAMGPTPMTGIYGVNDKLEAMIKAGGAQTMESAIPEDWLDWLSVVGDPAEAAQAIGKLFDAGSTSVVLCVAPGEGLAEQIAFIGREVLPRL
jgi:5,10-methylenetetrahydromethanopterin reductase